MRSLITKSLLTLLVAACAGLILPPSVDAAAATEGFIYGTVTTTSGNSYTGVLRWGTEEAFWDDLFHSSKEELPYAEYAEEAEGEDDHDRERWWITGMIWEDESEENPLTPEFL